MNVILESLPSKEGSKFEKIIKLYDQKLYKKAHQKLLSLIKNSSERSGLIKRVRHHAVFDRLPNDQGPQ